MGEVQSLRAAGGSTRSSGGDGTRSAPIPDFLVDHLVCPVEGRAAVDLVFGPGTRSCLHLPTGMDGWPEPESGLGEDETIPAGLTIHDLRCTAASLAISAGANLKAVQRMPGTPPQW